MYKTQLQMPVIALSIKKIQTIGSSECGMTEEANTEPQTLARNRNEISNNSPLYYW
jgi:hypothetical protein